MMIRVLPRIRRVPILRVARKGSSRNSMGMPTVTLRTSVRAHSTRCRSARKRLIPRMLRTNDRSVSSISTMLPPATTTTSRVAPHQPAAADARDHPAEPTPPGSGWSHYHHNQLYDYNQIYGRAAATFPHLLTEHARQALARQQEVGDLPRDH